MADQATWFDEHNRCRCGKSSTGILRDKWNGSLGSYCKPCATARIKKAEAEREKEKKVG